MGGSGFSLPFLFLFFFNFLLLWPKISLFLMVCLVIGWFGFKIWDFVVVISLILGWGLQWWLEGGWVLVYGGGWWMVGGGLGFLTVGGGLGYLMVVVVVAAWVVHWVFWWGGGGWWFCNGLFLFRRRENIERERKRCIRLKNNKEVVKIDKVVKK